MSYRIVATATGKRAKMRISEAMRKGAALGPQLFNRLMDDEGGSCAYGAVIKVSTALTDILGGMAPEAVCPVGPCAHFTADGLHRAQQPVGLLRVVVHLNNDHRWTREKIADWIEATYEGGLKIPAVEIREFCGMGVKA
jgi:hypothetical protein